MRHHDLDLDANGPLSHLHVAHRLGDVVPLGLARGDEVALPELHGLGALSPELAADDDLHALGAVLHDEPEHAVAGTTHRQPADELKAQGLALGHGTACAILDALGEELHAVLRETETLLHQGRQLSNASALLAQDFASPGGSDDDLGSDGRHPHLHAGIAVLSQGSGQELVELGVENAICHELTFLGDLCCRHVCSEGALAWRT
mmetsp:Transcript_63146/g.150879  ORF Transcript_63146/g.150879 Transcript_63146/m.150879 type:complete len:205 (+) Transcript_63146:189-803(+)